MANDLVAVGVKRAARRPGLTSSHLLKSLERIIFENFGRPERPGSGFDLLCPVPSGDRNCGQTFGQKIRRFLRLKWAPKLHFLVSLVLVCASVECLLNLRHQYAYDANRALHNKITSKLGAGSSRFSFRINNRNGSELLDHIEAKAHEARRWLKYFGAAHCEWSFASQISYIYVWVPACIFVLVAPVCMKFNGLAYFSWARWQFDEAGERRHWARLTADELQRFEGLMLMASQVKFNRDKEVLHKLSVARRVAGRRASLPATGSNRTGESGVSSTRRFEQIVHKEIVARSELMQLRHAAARRQLKSIALDGRLGTLSRTRQSLSSMAASMLALSAVQICYVVCMTLWVYRRLESLFFEHGKHAEFLNIKDALESCCLAYFLFLATVVCVTNKSYNLVTALDQANSVDRLDRLVRTTIARSEWLCRGLLTREPRRASTISTRSFERPWDSRRAGARPLDAHHHQVAGPTTEHVAQCLDQLELGLLRVILEYRLFMAQYELAMRPVRFYGLFYFYVLLSLALLIRIHAPYLYPELKVMGASLSYILIAPQYFYMLPLCHLHRRCMNLFERQYSLVAQMAHYETRLNLRNCISLEIAIATLRRCLIRPEHARAKLTCRALFLDITYTSMLKITFWISLLIIPMLNSKQSSDGLMSSIMSDPLGIFSF